MKTLMILGLSVALSACASEPFKPKVREFDPGKYPERPAPARGSVLAGAPRGLVEDVRPRDVGDVIIVRIDEADSASHDDRARLSRDSQLDYGINASSGASEAFAAKVGAESGQRFDGAGQIQKKGTVRGNLPVRVQKVLPGGDLYVEGTKTVVVGGETRHLYISGIVRPFDVLADGSILSSRIADAEIEYTGDGDASDQQRPGWFSRILGRIWPF